RLERPWEGHGSLRKEYSTRTGQRRKQKQRTRPARASKIEQGGAALVDPVRVARTVDDARKSRVEPPSGCYALGDVPGFPPTTLHSSDLLRLVINCAGSGAPLHFFPCPSTLVNAGHSREAGEWCADLSSGNADCAFAIDDRHVARPRTDLRSRRGQELVRA